LKERLIDAGRSRQPAPILAQADTDLAKLRLYLRLCRDLELVKFNQYEHGQRIVDEIGRLMGGMSGFGWSSMTLAARPVNPVVHGRGAAPETNESQPGPAPVAPGLRPAGPIASPRALQ